MLIHYEGGLHMTKYREILRLTALGLSLRDIEKSLKVSRKTVVKVQKRADELSLSWPLDESLTDAELEQRMFPKDLSPKSTKRMPDFDYIRKELLKNGVNKKLLWTEYLEECSQNGDDALMYSQFCYYIQQNEQKSRATMHIPRKAGQQIEVDWAGDPAKIIDPDTGEITKAWIFVGVMTYSQYAFVEAFINEQQKSWITAHVHMYEFFGGVTPILVSDNAPTATNRKQSDKYESVLIKSYEELAQHYNTAIIPARVRAPKDKPSVEGNVGHVLLWSSFFVTLVAKKIVLINLCCRPCFIWGSITIITVWTNMIIINVCKFFYLLIECFLCCKLIQICAFILQGIEVTLHRCIVVRISCFAHALCHIYRFAEFGKCFGRIL